MRRRGLVAAGLVGMLAGLGVLCMSRVDVRLEPGSTAWSRMVLGPSDGSFGDGLVVRIPGLERREGDQLRIEAPPGTQLLIAVDRGPLQPVRASGADTSVLPLPARAIPGLRLDLRASPGEPSPPLRALRLQRTNAAPALPPLLAALAVLLLTLGLAERFDPRLVVMLGSLAAALLILGAAPAHVWLALPGASALAPLLLAFALLAVGVAGWSRLPPADRLLGSRLSLILAALVLGAFVRAAFVTSPGSWDTEYWRAWMLRSAAAGVTHVYGDADAVPAGQLLAQLRGQQELWKVRAFGRDFVVDYPPLAMALWRSAWFAVTHAARSMDSGEAQNAAVKLPAILGDLAALAVLLWTFPKRPLRGLSLAALYWVLPTSWLSSAVLGYLDWAYAPLAALSLVAAGRGRPRTAGAGLALACLIKPTAVVIAPAVAIALWTGRASIGRAMAAGLAVVAVALVPYALAGTLETAVVHVYRILFQGTLSGGFANPWWLVGHWASAARPGFAPLGPIQYARLDGLGFDPRPIGTVLFAVAALFVGWQQRRHAGVGAAALAGATLVFAYGMLAVGVHDNHPYPLFLLFLLTGLVTVRLRLIALGSAATLALNSLCLSGLGRFAGPRHESLEPVARFVGGLRMGLGFDFTLILALANAGLFVLLLATLGVELRRVAEAEAAA